MSIGLDSVSHLMLQLPIYQLQVSWIRQIKMLQNLFAIKSRYMWNSVWFHKHTLYYYGEYTLIEIAFVNGLLVY